MWCAKTEAPFGLRESERKEKKVLYIVWLEEKFEGNESWRKIRENKAQNFSILFSLS